MQFIIIRAEGENATAANITAVDKNNTIVFIAPLESLRAFEGFVKKTSGEY